MSVKEYEEWGTGRGMEKWQKCFDCGRLFHGAVCIALGWAAWKTYVGRPETDVVRCLALSALGNSLRPSRPEEALPMLEANVALCRRYWPRNEETIVGIHGDIASCLGNLGRRDEALNLQREVHARRMDINGVSHERTILSGIFLVCRMMNLKLYDEATSLVRDQLLPAARQSLGADDDLMLKLNYQRVKALANNPKHTRDSPRLNQHYQCRYSGP